LVGTLIFSLLYARKPGVEAANFVRLY